MGDNNFIDLFRERLDKLYGRFFRGHEGRFDASCLTDCTEDLTEEEREVLTDACEYVDIYYRKRKELEESGQEPERWLESQIEMTAKELDPDASAADIDELKQAVAHMQEQRNAEAADALDREMTPVSETLEKTETIEKKGGRP